MTGSPKSQADLTFNAETAAAAAAAAAPPTPLAPPMVPVLGIEWPPIADMAGCFSLTRSTLRTGALPPAGDAVLPSAPPVTCSRTLLADARYWIKCHDHGDCHTVMVIAIKVLHVGILQVHCKVVIRLS